MNDSAHEQRRQRGPGGDGKLVLVLYAVRIDERRSSGYGVQPTATARTHCSSARPTPEETPRLGVGVTQERDAFFEGSNLRQRSCRPTKARRKPARTPVHARVGAAQGRAEISSADEHPCCAALEN